MMSYENITKNPILTLDVLYSDDLTAIVELINQGVFISAYEPSPDSLIIDTGVSISVSSVGVWAEIYDYVLYLDLSTGVLVKSKFSSKNRQRRDEHNASRLVGLIQAVDAQKNFSPTEEFVVGYNASLFSVDTCEFRSSIQRMFIVYALHLSDIINGEKILPVHEEDDPFIKRLTSSLVHKYGYFIQHNSGVLFDLGYKIVTYDEYSKMELKENQRKTESKRIALEESEDSVDYADLDRKHQRNEMDRMWNDEMDSYGMSDVELDRS